MLSDTQWFSLENSIKIIMENCSIDFIFRKISFIIPSYGEAHAHENII